jgi:hypothetical protein
MDGRGGTMRKGSAVRLGGSAALVAAFMSLAPLAPAKATPTVVNVPEAMHQIQCFLQRIVP